jgi:small GTP-binding protein
MPKKARTIRIVMLGSEGVGKSAFVEQYIAGRFLENHETTETEQVYKKDLEVGERVHHLEIYDIAGHYQYCTPREEVIRKAHGFIMMYNITSKDSFEDTDNFRVEILRNQRPWGFAPVLLVGNMTDLEPSRQITSAQGQKKIQTWINAKDNEGVIGKIGFCEAAGKINFKVEDAFEQLAEMILQPMKDRAPLPKAQEPSRFSFAILEKLRPRPAQKKDTDEAEDRGRLHGNGSKSECECWPFWKKKQKKKTLIPLEDLDKPSPIAIPSGPANPMGALSPQATSPSQSLFSR